MVQSAKKFGSTQKLYPKIATNKYAINLKTIIERMAMTKTSDIMKMMYFSMYGHRGNKTTAITPKMIAGNSQVFGSAKSNLNEANFDLELAYDLSNWFGYFNFGRFSGREKYMTSFYQTKAKSLSTLFFYSSSLWSEMRASSSSVLKY
jgi:hypothetical protein